MKNVFSKLFSQYWNPYYAIGIAGVLSALYFGLTNTVWAVTGEFTRLGGHILMLFGVDISNWEYFKLVTMNGSSFERTDGWIVWGMFIGAFITILLSNNFKIRIPKQKRRLFQGLIGGVIAGFGARLALGCNLAAFFTGVPQFSFHSWIFMIATAIGTYIGFKIVSMKWWKGKPVLKKGNSAAAIVKDRKIIQPKIGMIIAIFYVILIISFFMSGKSLLGISAIFGAAFGILIERGQICFTSAFRDLWVSGRATMTKAIAAGIAISTVFTFIVIMVYGFEPITKIAAPSTFIGGLLFGLGIVLAGGCETGMMYRVMEGQVLYLFVFAGNIIGATFLAYGWDHLGIFNALVKSGSKVNLLAAIGPIPALVATLAMLGLWFAVAVYWEKHYRFGTGFKKGANKQHGY
ncbi:selenium metabolism membrane protein YedE/FdhT [Bacillus sp. S/N-304-OC-R1]|uniref:selenium metabolism membrane protein YedE/FdhT n=1 Tax=Bacillus sp. S/N-304-OC-R1 TaxID=2758034 RepID=UPI001C8D5D43|nr:selenium metabolism membrane protein YedE/FdhT [Bacillus sp. S/N-304-OC-R1]MBY0124161.1 selenium metabolism membrane protein YedE/FdhT [Bacillus sp. S/N-304-OC-R1]